uniref:Tetratricopeptide repeat protein 7 N-terminal domain-containing protein n=1 Tax=Plectus sambesii TaxID=2011161 RepID=A0A914XNV1_9BILA
DNAKLERNDIQFQTLRTLRLVAEAYAIKGLSLEKLPLVSKSSTKYQKSQQSTQVLYCFEKAAELSLAYIQELEKAVPAIGSITGGATSGQLSLAVPHSAASASTPTAKPAEKIGDLMETAIQRVPLMHIRAQMSRAESTGEGVEWYRRILTETGDKPIAHHLHQKLSRQLAEVLLRGVPDSSYSSPATNSQAVAKKAQSLRFYFGPNRLHYCPDSRLEEVMLALSVSEALAAREAVLSRSEEDSVARQESIMNVKAVQNLLTLVLSTIRQYQLLAGVLEKSMKFAYEDRFIWLQFSLSLMCLGRWARSSQVLSQCIAETPDSDRDPVQHMFAAKLHIEQLGQYDKGIEHAQMAIDLCQGGWLSGRAKILLGLGHSLKTQMAATYPERQVGHRYTVRLFEDAAKSDPKDHLAEFFLALQLAMGRENDEALQHCEKSLSMHAEQPTALMLLALLLTARGEHKDALDIVLDALDEFPNHYGLLVLRLKLEVGFNRTDQALATARDLLLFWKTVGSEQCGGNDPATAADRVHSSQSNMTDGPLGPQSVVFSPPSLTGMGHNTTTASSSLLAPIASMSALDITDKESMMGGTSAALSEYGGAASTVSDSIGLASASSGQRGAHSRFRVQANIWLELAQLFLEAGRISDVQRCVDEACQAFPNSHQALYLK